MRDSKSWTEIRIFNHHLSWPIKSYNDFFFLQRPIYDKIPIDKIYLLLLSIKKTDSNCPLVVFCFPFCFPPSLRYNITHSSNFNFYLGTTHLKKKNISNFMLLEKPLVITTNLSQLFKLIDREIELYEWRMYLLIFFVFFFHSLFHFTVFVAGFFLFLVFFFFSYLPARCIVFLFSSFLSVLSAPVRSSYSCLFVLVFSFYFFQFQHFSLSPSLLSCCNA